MSIATANERYFLSLVNQTRADLGLAPLQLETRLNSAADDHSRWMLESDTFSHIGAGGSNWTDRVVDAGFDLGGNWRVAENLAYVSVNNNGSLQDEVRALHQALVNSPGHYANMVDPGLEYIGIGLQRGDFRQGGRDHDMLMVTQNFAATEGHVRIDAAPGVTIATVDFTMLPVQLPQRADFQPLFDGQVLTASRPGQVLHGSPASDDIRLGAGADSVQGGAGHDWIAGGAGADVLRGGQGDDFILGQGGHDRLFGAAGHDRIAGGGGNDVIRGGAGRDSLHGGVGHDLIDGDAGADLLWGGAGADTLRGGAGHDWLHGGGGRDILRGGAGQDTLVGGAGNDSLYGGGGADTFVFQPGSGVDHVINYQPGIDRIFLAQSLVEGDPTGFVQDNIRQTAAGVVIDFGPGHRVVFEGPELRALDIADDVFLF